jgi:hypothetical protein
MHGFLLGHGRDGTVWIVGGTVIASVVGVTACGSDIILAIFLVLK